MKPSRLKKALEFISGLLAIVKWLPVGQWRQIAVTLSAVVGLAVGMLTKCDSAEDTPSQPTLTPAPVITPSPTPTPTPKPTPRPPRIVIDRAIVANDPFTVRYTAPFAYNTHLWVDQYRLGYMGRDVDGTFILYAVILRTPGKRLLTIRNSENIVLASQAIEVNP